MTPPIIAGLIVALSARFLLRQSWRTAVISGAATGAVALFLRSKVAAPAAPVTAAPPVGVIAPPVGVVAPPVEGIAASGPGAIVPPGAVS